MDSNTFDNVSDFVACPSCGKSGMRITNYISLMVVRKDLGLFTLECPSCAAKVSTIHPIPKNLLDEVQAAAKEVGAGMGQAGSSI